MNAAGPAGELRVVYQRAAVLGNWTLEALARIPSTTFCVQAQLKTVDEFWITQQPMTLDLRFGRFHWVWDGVLPQCEDGHVTVRVIGKPNIVKE